MSEEPVIKYRGHIEYFRRRGRKGVGCNTTVGIILFPDLAGGRSRRRDLVKSDLYHVIACQECGRQVNSACLRQF